MYTTVTIAVLVPAMVCSLAAATAYAMGTNGDNETGNGAIASSITRSIDNNGANDAASVSSRGFNAVTYGSLDRETVPTPDKSHAGNDDATNESNSEHNKDSDGQNPNQQQSNGNGDTVADGFNGNNQQAIDWQSPSGGQYPDLSQYGDLSIDVNLTEQRTYVVSNGSIIYTMVSSTGMDGTTPTGDYTTGIRGEYFYNPNEGMGARWWLGFIGGTYLFHSVPTDVNGNWIESEAVKLGNPASHGCVRLTVADAKWLYESMPSGVPVHIHY